MSKSQKEPEKLSILSGLNVNDLKSIKIAITRNNIPYNGRLSPLKRSLDSPEKLKVHLKGVPNRKIFYRPDIIVNKSQEYHQSRRSGSLSNSEDGYVSHSPSNSPKKNKNKNQPESSDRIFKRYFNRKPPFPLPKEIDDENNYPSTSKGYTKYKSQQYSEKYNSRKRSPSHDYDKPGPSRYNRSPSYERHKKYRSPSPPSRSKYTEIKREDDYRSRTHVSPANYRNKSPSPKYRKVSRSPEPERKKKYSRSPRRFEESRRKHSKSPQRRRDRSQTPLRPGEYRPPRKTSPSEHKRKQYRSRSPPNRHHERSPPLKRGEYRPNHKRHYDQPEYPGFYDPSMNMFRPPFMPRFMPPGHVLVPHVQYIPIPQMPFRQQRPILTYNNRSIPRFVQNAPSTIVSELVDGDDDKPPGEGNAEDENK